MYDLLTPTHYVIRGEPGRPKRLPWPPPDADAAQLWPSQLGAFNEQLREQGEGLVAHALYVQGNECMDLGPDPSRAAAAMLREIPWWRQAEAERRAAASADGVAAAGAPGAKGAALAGLDRVFNLVADVIEELSKEFVVGMGKMMMQDHMQDRAARRRRERLEAELRELELKIELRKRQEEAGEEAA